MARQDRTAAAHRRRQPVLFVERHLYAPDRPSEFIDFDPMHAPWITPQRLRREGLGIICAAEDQECLTAARPYETAGSERFETVLQQSLLGWKGPPARLVMILVPPAAQP